MEQLETLKSTVQRETLKEAFLKEERDLFVTLHWRHKDYPIGRAHSKLNALDAWLGSAMVGKRFNRQSNFCKRVKWVGTLGRNEKQHLHAHLLVQLPPGAQEIQIVNLIDEYHKTLQGEDTYTLDVSLNDKTPIVNYILLQRHLPVEAGVLNLNHIVFSHNYEMPRI